MTARKRHLLIVEDNEALSQMLAWEFQDLGYRVTVAGNCRQALQAAHDKRVDLALLDYNLPDGRGTELIDPLRTLNPEMRLIVCSGYYNGLGFDRPTCQFVAKPVSAKKLHRLFQCENKPG